MKIRIIVFINILLFCLFINQPVLATSQSEDFRFSPRPNRAKLINWRPWGKDAFEEAKRLDRLVLLSLSAVWCHWCHVMDETTYSDKEIIDFINRHYIPIRVDADRRPDIDNIYNQGGWPSTVILTPEGEVLNGGTYIPPERMLEMLKESISFYKKNKAKIKKRIAELRRFHKQDTQTEESSEEDYVVIETIIKSLEENFDEKYGGFDIGQKFPRPEVLEFLLTYYGEKRKSNIERMITRSLDAMAISMLYDHEEGGFFRYSVKRDWSEPHYEKMLDTNSALLKVYTEAYSVFKKELYLKTAKGIYSYLIRSLYDKDTGLFYGSQDADETYYQSRNRASLKPPPIDRTIYADRNGLALSALSTFAELTENNDAKARAIRAANSLIKSFYKKGRGVYHYRTDGTKEAKISGLLQDNVLFATGLLDIYELTGQREFLTIAKDTARLLDRKFSKGGLLRASIGQSFVNPVTGGMLRKYSLLKNNYQALILFNRLKHYDPYFKKSSERLRKALSGTYKRLYFTSSLFGTALEYSMIKPFEIDIVSKAENLDSLMEAINSVYMPFKVVRVYLLGKNRVEIAKKGYPLRESIYICRGKRCFKPIRPSKDMKGIIAKILSKGTGR